MLVDVDGRTTGIDPSGKREVSVGAEVEEPVPERAPEWADRAAVALGGTVIAWRDPYRSGVRPRGVVTLTGKLTGSSEAPAENRGVYDAIVRHDGKVAFLGWGNGVLDEVTLPTAAVRTGGKHPVGIRVIDQSPTSQPVSTMDDDGRTLIWLP